MEAVHPCPACRTSVEHEKAGGAHARCPGCGAALRFILMFGDGNLVLVDPTPTTEPHLD